MVMEVTVGYGDDDIRLDRWVKRHRQDIPHALLQKWLRAGKVRLDGAKAEAGTRVRAGQVLTLPAPDGKAPVKREAARVTPEDAKRVRGWVIFENDHLIALNKPAGVAVQGGTGVKESVDGLLAGLVKDGAERPKLVHRIDRDTSGVLVVAKSAKAAAELARAFASRDAEKTYWALVVGVPRLNEGTIDLSLAKTSHGRSAFETMSVEESEDAKRAVTDYRVVEKLGTRLSWLELYPRTGRTHQLRAHLLAIRHPIVGDGKYGGAEAFPEGEIAPKLHLHARALALPVFGREVRVEAPLSGHMKETWKTLGLAE